MATPESLENLSDNGPKEEAILSAAMDVFLEKGSYGARMQEIADRAGVNKNLLHYYFRKKENIYRRVVEHVFLSFFGAIERALTQDDSFPVVLRKFIDTLMDSAAKDPRIPLFVMAELSQGGQTAREALISVFNRSGKSMPERMVEIIRREQESGNIRPVNPPQLIITILGACIYYFVSEPIVQTMLSRVQPGKVYNREEFIAERKESIFHVVYYGLKVQDNGADE